MPSLIVTPVAGSDQYCVSWNNKTIGVFDAPNGIIDYRLSFPHHYDGIDSALLHIQRTEGCSDFERIYIRRLEAVLLDYISLNGDIKKSSGQQNIDNGDRLVGYAVELSKSLILNAKSKSDLDEIPSIAAAMAKRIVEECKQ